MLLFFLRLILAVHRPHRLSAQCCNKGKKTAKPIKPISFLCVCVPSLSRPRGNRCPEGCCGHEAYGLCIVKVCTAVLWVIRWAAFFTHSKDNFATKVIWSKTKTADSKNSKFRQKKTGKIKLRNAFKI